MPLANEVRNFRNGLNTHHTSAILTTPLQPIYHLISPMPPVRTSTGATNRGNPERGDARSRRDWQAAAIALSRLERPLTRSRARNFRFCPISSVFSPYPYRYIPSTLSISSVPAQAHDSAAFDENTPSGTNDFESIFESSPAPLPPTSPEILSDAPPSPMSTVTPRRQYRTRPTTPDTPTPAARRGGARGIRRTYAMVISPVMRPPTPLLASVSVGLNGEHTPRVEHGMSISH